MQEIVGRQVDDDSTNINSDFEILLNWFLRRNLQLSTLYVNVDETTKLFYSLFDNSKKIRPFNFIEFILLHVYGLLLTSILRSLLE